MGYSLKTYVVHSTSTCNVWNNMNIRSDNIGAHLKSKIFPEGGLLSDFIMV